MTSDDRGKDPTRYLPNLWHSLVQVIIQSRLGEKTYTVSKSPAKGSTMFNLEINWHEDITQTIKKHMGNQTITQDNPFSIEILLRTKDGDVMVLEVWTLSVEDNVDSSSPKICQLTDRMSVLLKSAICVSRITPAYGLSFRQSADTYIILYRLYTGKPNYSCLGTNAVQVKVGQTNIQSAFLSIHLAYRTVLAITSQPKIMNPDQMMLKSDHFKVDSSPKHHRRISERVTDSSDTALTSDESQDATRLPFNTQMDLHSTSPRSRTSSESSNRGPQSNLSTEKIFVPFANYTQTSFDEYSLPDDIPFSSLLVSATIEKPETRRDLHEVKFRKISETDSESKSAKGVVKAASCEKTQMNSSDNSNKSFASNNTKEDNDYVVVDLKTPFVGSDMNDAELSSFFKEWQSAPPLHMFTDSPPEEVALQESIGLSEQIKCFEECADEYNDLVKSLHLDDQSSQELS